MKLLFFNNWTSDETLNALGWTLFHSLWIGLLAAVVSGVIIIVTRRSTAQLRYNLLATIMFLFLVSCTITFFIQTQVPKLNIAEVQETGAGIVNTTVSTGEYVFKDSISFTDQFTKFFNANAKLFVFIWLIFFIVHCIKLMTGLAAVNRLRNHKTDYPGDKWIAKMNDLRDKLGIRQSVTLLQSELIKVPVAVGFLKPAILVPIGLLSNLPPDQVEAILLHELAHIRRKDYLINLIQRSAEAIFFFNPAFMWLCSLIRQEREACCDDIVVATTGQKQNYLQALVSFQEYSFRTPDYAMGIRSKQYYLLNRVKRLLTHENKKLNAMEKLLLLFGLIVFTAFTIAPKTEEIKKKQSTNAIEINQPTESKTPSKVFVKKPVIKVQDTVPPNSLKNISSNVNIEGNTKTETITAIDAAGKKYTIVRVNDKLISLQVDDKAIPENEVGNYSSVINQIDQAREKKRQRKLKEIEERKLANEKKKEEQQNKMKEKAKIIDEKMKSKIAATDNKSKEAINNKIEAKRKEIDADRKILDKKRKEMSDVKNEIIIKKKELEKKDGKDKEVIQKQIKEKEKTVQNKLKEIESRKKIIGSKKEEIGKEKEKLERIKEKEKNKDIREKEKENKMKDKGDGDGKGKGEGGEKNSLGSKIRENSIALRQEVSHIVDANIKKRNSQNYRSKLNADMTSEVHAENKASKSEWDLNPAAPGWRPVPPSKSAPDSPSAPPKKLFKQTGSVFKKSGNRTSPERTSTKRVKL